MSPPTGHDGRRWLVLGASGYIGRAVVAALVERRCPVVGAARTRPSLPDRMPVELRTADARDGDALRALIRSVGPDVLLSAVAPAPSDGIDPTAFFVATTTILLDAVRAERPACRVLLLGSAAEYGNAPGSQPSSESDPLLPLTAYGRAKVAQLAVARRFLESGVAVATARVFNTVGPGQGRHLFAGALLERIRGGERVPPVRCANHVRDWVDIRDVAAATLALAQAADLPPVANVCTGVGRSVAEVAAAVARLTGVTVVGEPGETGPDVVWRSVGDPARMLSLGWRPRYDLAVSLADQWRHAKATGGVG